MGFEVWGNLEKDLSDLEELSKKEIPDEKSYDKFFEILEEYITWIDGSEEESKRYKVETHKGYSVAASKAIENLEEEIAINIFRYERNNVLFSRVNKMLDDKAKEYGVIIDGENELYAKYLIEMAAKKLERMEKRRQKTAEKETKKYNNGSKSK